MKNKLFIMILFMMFIPCTVHAASYTTTDNLFENTYTNNLVDMAQTQIENITTKKYAIIQINYDYYFIVAEKNDITVTGNTINMNNTTIIKAIRTQNNYNYYYDYSTTNEAKTTVYASNVIISNIDTSKSISSKRISDYVTNKNIQILLMFILGILFAIFLTKERKY